MYSRLCKERGAVAVFLVIVLVPMLVISSIFVDASRVKLAQSVVTSSGDLALNTLMTNYDYDLNDFYGMLASAQDMTDITAAVEEYFTSCMVSAGVDTTFAKKYANKVKGIFVEDADIADLLDISVEGEVKVEPMKNGSLDNPALIKTQIVDFMKYRSPINAASELLGFLTDVSKSTDTLEEETKCSEEQEDFYETEEKLLDLAKKAYDDLLEYEKIGVTETYVNNIKTNMARYRDDYYHAHYKLVYDLAGTQNVSKFQKTDKTSYTNNYYNADRLATDGDLKNFTKNTAIAMRDFLAARNKLNSLLDAFDYSNGTYQTRYYVNVMAELNKNNQYGNFITKLNSLTKNIVQLKNAYEYSEHNAIHVIFDLSYLEGVNAAGEASVDVHYKKLIAQYDEIIQNDYNNTQCAYKVFSNRLSNISGIVNNSNNSQVPTQNGEIPAGGIYRDPTDAFINGIYNEINDYYNTLDSAEKKVDDAAGNLKKLKKKIKSYHEDFETWKDAANADSIKNSKSGVSFESRKDIAERESDPDIMKNVTEENVQALIDRINNIKSAIGSLKEALSSYKYNNTKVMNIKNLKDFESASGVVASEISTFKSEIKSYAEKTFKFTEAENIVNITNNNNPSLDVNKPVIYKWMEERFTKPDESKYTKEKAKEKYGDLKKEKEGYASGEDEAQLGADQPEFSKVPNQPLPSNGDTAKILEAEKGSDLTKLTEFITDLFGDLGGTLKNGGIKVRDNLYTIDYIMSMFSYDTYESEKLLDLWVKDNPDKKITLSTDFKSAYKDDFNKNTDPVYPYNKSLTNKIINTTTCYSYGNEVEYILYGKSNAENKASIYGTIYMIRFALDIGPVFSKHFSDNPAVTAIASAISAATSGVIPEAVIKFVICLALSAAEAAKDLSYIKKGIGIKLIKSKDELFMNFSKDSFSSGNENAGTGNSGLYLQYSDYVKLLLFMSLLDSDKADAVYLRIGDVIQANMGKITKQQEGKPYLLSNAHIYYSLSANIKVAPILIGLPIVTSNIGGETAKSFAKFNNSGWNTFEFKMTRGY